MNDLRRLDTLLHLALWLALASVSILARLLPLGGIDAGWPVPDLLLALTLAWVLRRPAHLPAPAIAFVFLAEDLFLMRPPGLMALVVLVGSEFLRQRETVVRELNLLLEWLLVAAVMTVMALAYRLVLALVMIPNAPLGLSLAGLIVTIVAYPLVVLTLQGLLGVRKPATGEVDDLGRKL